MQVDTSLDCGCSYIGGNVIFSPMEAAERAVKISVRHRGDMGRDVNVH